jgi:hypothetical protein
LPATYDANDPACSSRPADTPTRRISSVTSARSRRLSFQLAVRGVFHPGVLRRRRLALLVPRMTPAPQRRAAPLFLPRDAPQPCRRHVEPQGAPFHAGGYAGDGGGADDGLSHRTGSVIVVLTLMFLAVILRASSRSGVSSARWRDPGRVRWRVVSALRERRGSSAANSSGAGHRETQ